MKKCFWGFIGGIVVSSIIWAIICCKTVETENEEGNLPHSEISKLELNEEISFSSGRATANIYNGTNWYIKGVIVLITVENPEGSEKLSRKYVFEPKEGYADPLKSTKYFTTIGFEAVGGENLKVNIVGAKGRKRKPSLLEKIEEIE